MFTEFIPLQLDAQSPDELPYDSTLPYDRPGAQINRGCPEGYFAQFVPEGMRCRLMATTTAQTISQESGQEAAQTWYNVTNTGFGAGVRDFLEQLAALPKMLLIGGAIGAVLVLVRR